MYKIILLLFLLPSCTPIEKTHYVESEALEHVQKFSQIYNLKINIEIKYTDLEKDVAGVCYIYSDNKKNIEIDEKIFKEYTHKGKEQLIFHELGHCILDREHNEKFFISKGASIPFSIMYPFTFGDYWFYNENITHYYDELIKGRNHE